MVRRILIAGLGGLAGLALWYVLLAPQGVHFSDVWEIRTKYEISSLIVSVVVCGVLAMVIGEKCRIVPSQEEIDKRLRPVSIFSTVRHGTATDMHCQVVIDLTGWRPTDNAGRWQTVASDEMKIRVAELAFPEVSDLNVVRAFFRRIVESRNGALISCDPVEHSSPPTFRTVYKYPTGRAHAVTFEGSLVAPIGNICVELLITASEDNFTGVREALVLSELSKTAGASEREQLARNELPIEWKFERYQSGTRGSWAYLISDDEKYDAAYPNHPLTRVRRWLRRIEKTYRVIPILESHREEKRRQGRIEIRALPITPMGFEEIIRELGFEVAEDAIMAEAAKQNSAPLLPLAERQKSFRDRRDAELKKLFDTVTKARSIREEGEKLVAELTPDTAKLILARSRATGHWLIQPEGGQLALASFNSMASFDDYTEAKELPSDPVVVTIRELSARLPELRAVGIDSLTIDRCPRCADERVSYKFDEFSNETKLLWIYAIHVAGQRHLVQEKLQAALQEPNPAQRLEILRHVIEHMNPASVATRVEMAKIAAANNDMILYEKCRSHVARYAPDEILLLPKIPG